MMGRFLSYACFLIALPLLLSFCSNDCNDKVADGHKEGNTLVSRLAGVERYRYCEHVDTIHHGGSEWEWVWACEDAPTLVRKNGSYFPLEEKDIRESAWLRLAMKVESWHELVLGLLLTIVGLVLYVRSFPPIEPASPPSPHP